MSPKISVIMSVYNGARHLREAVESILVQTFTDFEFLIVDDCSSDNSPQILKEYAEKDGRVRVITNEFNLGLTKNLNKLIRESRGEYLARFDCDDISLPKRFEEQVAFLDKNKNFGMCSVWAEIIDDKGSHLRELRYPTTNKELKKALIRYNPFFHPGLMIRKSVFEDVGLYNEDWRFAQDYELYFRVSKKYDVANVPSILLKYRQTTGSITSSKNRQQVELVLKAKLKALKEGQYSKLNYIHLVRSYISWALPMPIKKLLKKIF